MDTRCLALHSSYVHMLPPDLYALLYSNFFKFRLPTSSLACALFVYPLLLAETRCLTESLTTFHKHLKTFYFQASFSDAPVPQATHYPSTSDSIIGVWHFVNPFNYLLLTVCGWQWKVSTSTVHVVSTWWAAVTVVTCFCGTNSRQTSSTTSMPTMAAWCVRLALLVFKHEHTQTLHFNSYFSGKPGLAGSPLILNLQSFLSWASSQKKFFISFF